MFQDRSDVNLLYIQQQNVGRFFDACELPVPRMYECFEAIARSKWKNIRIRRLPGQTLRKWEQLVTWLCKNHSVKLYRT